MKLTTYESVGIAASVGCMALALWLINVEATTDRIAGDVTGDTQAAVVAGSSGNDQADLADALVDAGVSADGVERLVIDDIVRGSGDAVTDGDTVTVHYIGSLTSGTQFDNSYTRGEPLTLTVGAGRVIAGWEQGLIGMQPGGQRVLVIPPELAYGSAGNGPVPPNSTLVFAIELISIE